MDKFLILLSVGIAICWFLLAGIAFQTLGLVAGCACIFFGIAFTLIAKSFLKE